MKAHPLLLESTPTAAKPTTSKKDRFKPMAPKFASTKANARVVAAATSGPSSEPVKANPYTTTTTSTTGARTAPQEGFEGAPKERVGRTLRFNAKGKYIQKGIEMRSQVRRVNLLFECTMANIITIFVGL
jgi:U4/U6 small nuclear ribonucleoprotein PRP3